ncbi:MAG: cation transporter [Faecalibacterium sp.]
MKRVFILKGLDCPNCSAKIEKEVGALPGVESSVVNLMQQTLTVQSEKSADATLAEQVETIVHSHEPDVEVSEKDRTCGDEGLSPERSGLSELLSKNRERSR